MIDQLLREHIFPEEGHHLKGKGCDPSFYTPIVDAAKTKLQTNTALSWDGDKEQLEIYTVSKGERLWRWLLSWIRWKGFQPFLTSAEKCQYVTLLTFKRIAANALLSNGKIAPVRFQAKLRNNEAYKDLRLLCQATWLYSAIGGVLSALAAGGPIPTESRNKLVTEAHELALCHMGKLRQPALDLLRFSSRIDYEVKGLPVPPGPEVKKLELATGLFDLASYCNPESAQRGLFLSPAGQANWDTAVAFLKGMLGIALTDTNSFKRPSFEFVYFESKHVNWGAGFSSRNSFDYEVPHPTVPKGARVRRCHEYSMIPLKVESIHVHQLLYTQPMQVVDEKDLATAKRRAQDELFDLAQFFKLNPHIRRIIFSPAPKPFVLPHKVVMAICELEKVEYVDLGNYVWPLPLNHGPNNALMHYSKPVDAERVFHNQHEPLMNVEWPAVTSSSYKGPTVSFCYHAEDYGLKLPIGFVLRISAKARAILNDPSNSADEQLKLACNSRQEIDDLLWLFQRACSDGRLDQELSGISQNQLVERFVTASKWQMEPLIDAISTHPVFRQFTRACDTFKEDCDQLTRPDFFMPEDKVCYDMWLYPYQLPQMSSHHGSRASSACDRPGTAMTAEFDSEIARINSSIAPGHHRELAKPIGVDRYLLGLKYPERVAYFQTIPYGGCCHLEDLGGVSWQLLENYFLPFPIQLSMANAKDYWQIATALHDSELRSRISEFILQNLGSASAEELKQWHKSSLAIGDTAFCHGLEMHRLPQQQSNTSA